MPRHAIARSLVAGLALLALATASHAQDKQVYRYTEPDGRVVYSDKPPPANAKNAQTKRVGGNFIETDTTSLAEQQATERYPVTLFMFTCGEVCDTAQNMLNRRGVPFTTVPAGKPRRRSSTSCA